MCNHNEFMEKLNETVMSLRHKVDPWEATFLLIEYATMILYQFHKNLSEEVKKDLIDKAIIEGKKWYEKTKEVNDD